MSASSHQPIPFSDLAAQWRPLRDEVRAGFEALLDAGRFVGGEEVARFERRLAAWCGAQGALGVGNGTDGLVLALRALGVGPGDVVLVPAMTFVATAAAVAWVGATPRFVDIEPDAYTLDPGPLASSDLRGVRGVIVVHLYGQAADLDAILAWARDRGLWVIEDAAQAHGTRSGARPVGGRARAGVFSFYPGKNLGALGDGGAVVSDDLELLARVARLANHGRAARSEHVEIGINSRLDAVQAMALGIALEHLEAWNARRVALADLYDRHLQGLASVRPPPRVPGRGHVYHQYVVQADDREGLRRSLAEQGIETAVHYPVALPFQPAFASLGHRPGDFPVSESLAARCLSLPLYPTLTAERATRVIEAVRRAG